MRITLILILAAVLSCTPESPRNGVDAAVAQTYDSVWRHMGLGRSPKDVVAITDSMILSASPLPASEEITTMIYGRGKALFKLGAYTEALACMARVIERRPHSTDLTRQALLFSGHTLRACNDTLGALATYKAVLRRTKPQEQARIADAEANIGMIFSWLAMRDSAATYALRARPRFAASGDTSGVAWTHRIIAGTSHNSLPHPRTIATVAPLPDRAEAHQMPSWETVLDAATDAMGTRWLASTNGLFRIVGQHVDQPIRESFADLPCLQIRLLPTNELAVLSAHGAWFAVDPASFTTRRLEETPQRTARITMHDRAAYQPVRVPKSSVANQLPDEIDPTLITAVEPGSDASFILYRGDLPPIRWWPENDAWQILFTRDGVEVGLLAVSDIAWTNALVYGAVSYLGLARWDTTTRDHRLILARTYRDGSAFAPGLIEHVGTQMFLLYEPDQTAMLTSSFIARIPPNGIDTAWRKPPSPWMLTGISRSGQQHAVAIPVTAGVELDVAESMRISTTTMNEVDWFFVNVSIDGGAAQRLPENGWLDLTHLQDGVHRIGISWSDGSQPVEFYVTVSGPWYTSVWGMLVLVFAGAGSVGGLVWLVARRRTRRLLTQQRLLHEERERIARDLHDHVGSQLVRMSTLTQRIERSATPEEQQALMQRMRFAAREATRSLRDVLTISQTDTSTLQDVIALLRERIRELAGDIDFAPQFDIDASIDRPLSGEQRHHLVMFVMEAVNNASRHGGISTIGFVLQEQNGSVELSIVDDGVGRDPRDRAGMGTSSMEHRASVLKADLIWDTGFTGGTVVRLRWN